MDHSVVKQAPIIPSFFPLPSSFENKLYENESLVDVLFLYGHSDHDLTTPDRTGLTETGMYSTAACTREHACRYSVRYIKKEGKERKMPERLEMRWTRCTDEASP